MKKFLSAIIILALALTLALSLASCTATESTAVGEATLTNYKKDQPARRSDSEIEDLISVEFGYSAYSISLHESAPEYLDGLYYSGENVYFAYLRVYDDYGLLEAEVIAKIYPDRPFEYSYLTILGSTTDRLYRALQQAANYVLLNDIDENKISDLVWDKFAEINGYCSSYRGYHTYEKGVSDLYYSDEFNTYIAYINTFGMMSYNTGVMAFVVIRDNIILEVDVLAYCFAEDIDDFPGEYDVEVFFEQFIGIDPRNDHMYPLDGYATVSNDFINSLQDIQMVMLKMSDNWFDQLRYLLGTSPIYWLIVAIIVIAAVILVASHLLVPVLLITIFVLLIIIIIISICKKKHKKRLRALRKELAEADEAKVESEETKEDPEKEANEKAE